MVTKKKKPTKAQKKMIRKPDPGDVVEYKYDDGIRIYEGVGMVVNPKNAYTPGGYVVVEVPAGKTGTSTKRITVPLEDITIL
jgi:hypothetical protein